MSDAAFTEFDTENALAFPLPGDDFLYGRDKQLLLNPFKYIAVVYGETLKFSSLEEITTIQLLADWESMYIPFEHLYNHAWNIEYDPKFMSYEEYQELHIDRDEARKRINGSVERLNAYGQAKVRIENDPQKGYVFRGIEPEPERYICLTMLLLDTKENRLCDDGTRGSIPLSERDVVTLRFLTRFKDLLVPNEWIIPSVSHFWDSSVTPEKIRFGINGAVNQFNNMGRGFAWIENDGNGYIYRENHGQGFNKQLYKATRSKYVIR